MELTIAIQQRIITLHTRDRIATYIARIPVNTSGIRPFRRIEVARRQVRTKVSTRVVTNAVIVNIHQAIPKAVPTRKGINASLQTSNVVACGHIRAVIVHITHTIHIDISRKTGS
tara:strand:- start:124 stop:468 length:345 start_codon:yes stop_codon:yes gene_type:complete